MEDNLVRLLHAQLDLSSRTAQLLLDSIKSRSASPTPALKATANVGARRSIKVHNPKAKRELIFVVEDDVDIADYATDILLKEGYKVVVAHDGAEAVQIFGEMGDQIRLVILDFFLPSMEGDAVFSEIRAVKPDANVLLCSGFLTHGFVGQDKLDSMVDEGLRGFLPKPYTRQKLLEHVSWTLKAA